MADARGRECLGAELHHLRFRKGVVEANGTGHGASDLEGEDPDYGGRSRRLGDVALLLLLFRGGGGSSDGGPHLVITGLRYHQQELVFPRSSIPSRPSFLICKKKGRNLTITTENNNNNNKKTSKIKLSTKQHQRNFT